MSKAQIFDVVQHHVTTFALAYFTALSVDPNIATKSALIMAAVTTLRDVRSLIKNVNEISSNEVEEVVKRSVGRPKKEE